MPPAAVPKTSAAFVVSLRSAFACWRSGALTVCGTIPVEAGKKKDDAIPRTTWSAAKCQISALPVRSRIAAAA